MKIKFFISAFLIAIAVFVAGCQKNIIQEDTYPPAQIFITHSQNIIEVPATNYKNYTENEADQLLHITLGISRSGLELPETFTVKVGADQDTIQQMIDEGTLTGTIPMSEDMFILPEEVTVEKGQSGALIHITIDTDKIRNIREKVALAVTINAASSFNINPRLRTAVIVINYRKISGIIHPGDEPAPGRIFETFTSEAIVAEWNNYNHTNTFEGPDKIRMVQGNIDGYGITKKENVTYDMDAYPILAIRVYQQPLSGGWLFKSFNGPGDMSARPSSASEEQMPDNSRIYYWNMHDLTSVRGIVTGGNYQLATEGANGAPFVISWIKSFESIEAVREYADEER